MSAPLVSIVIPTKNGMATLPGLLQWLRCTDLHVPFEIVAVDSGSYDGTLALLESHADRVVSIPPGTFDHGLARNRGIAEARADLIALTVQDAMPASEHWLRQLIHPLQRSARLAGTYARQQPREDASPLTRHYLERAPVASKYPRTSRLRDEAELLSLAPLDRLMRCTFDNVCSCIRRSVWIDHPFAATPIAEDLRWAREVLLAGYELMFMPEVVVRHSHERPARYEYARTRMLHRQLADLFGLRTIPTLAALAASVAGTAALHWRLQRPERSGRSRALALALAWPLGQYLGGLDARRRRRQFRADGV